MTPLFDCGRIRYHRNHETSDFFYSLLAIFGARIVPANRVQAKSNGTPKFYCSFYVDRENYHESRRYLSFANMVARYVQRALPFGAVRPDLSSSHQV